MPVPPHESLIRRCRALHRALFLSAFLACLFSGRASLTRAAAPEPPRTVLILNSYHQGLAWTDHQVAAAREVLEKAFPGLELHIEYMDTKRLYTEDYLQQLADIYRLKYAGCTFDAIIATDDNALHFVMRHHDDHFANAPVSFCGINDYYDSLLQGRDQFTGLVEVLDIAETLDLALKLHPGTRKVAVVVDSTPTGIGHHRAVAEAARQYASLDFAYLSGDALTHAELVEQLRALPPDSICLLTVWLRDKDDRYLPPAAGGRVVSAVAPVPVYGITDMYLGHGIVGGRLLNSATHGRVCAELAVRIMHGEKPASIPVIVLSTNPWMFDHRQLARWNIDSSRLPAGSVIVNEPFSFYRTYKRWVWSITGAFAVLLLLVSALFLNIIYRKRVERALTESQNRYRTLVDNIDLGIALVDKDYRIVMVNRKHAAMLNRPPESFVGNRCHQVFEHRDRVCDHCPGAVAMRTGKPAETAFSAVLPDGTPAEVRIRAFPLRENGQMYGFIEVVEDITERTRAEQALEESEKRFRMAFENAVDAILWAELDTGIIVKCNRAAEDLFETTADTLIGRHQLSLHPPDNEQYYRSIFTTTPKLANRDAAIVTATGAIRYVSISHSETEIAGKKVRQGIFRDITDRRKTEAEMVRLLSAIDQSNDSLMITDENGVIQFANTASVQISGFPKTDLLGKNLFRPQTSVYNREYYRRIWETVSSGRVWKDFISHRHANGTMTEYASVITPIKNSDGNIVNYVSVSRDISREVQLEQKLQQAQKLESIGTLAGGIAHDFNNILGAIIGNVDMLLERLPEGDDSLWHARQIHDAADRARNLVRQILAFSRKVPQDIHPFNIVTLVRESIAMLRSTIPATIDIETQIDCPRDTVSGDEAQIHQVFLNLCINAEQAMHESGGCLTIALTNVTLREKDARQCQNLQPGHYIQLCITDTGPGISPRLIEKIFDPFFTTKGVGKGTGLGLSVVHGIVQNHKGAVRVESEEGRGTTFAVLLPLSDRQPVEQAADTQTPLPRGSANVLLLDDEDMILKVSTRMLENLGYTVSAFQNAEDALAAFRADPQGYDVVISDMTMPRMTGKAVAAEILTIRPGTPVIICTGFSDLISELECKTIGVRALLMKPCSKADLGRALRDALA